MPACQQPAQTSRMLVFLPNFPAIKQRRSSSASHLLIAPAPPSSFTCVVQSRAKHDGGTKTHQSGGPQPLPPPMQAQPPPQTYWDKQMQMLKRLAPFLWPKDDRSHRTRVVAALGCLILSKVATIQAPLLLGRLIDVLSTKRLDAVAEAAVATAASNSGAAVTVPGVVDSGLAKLLGLATSVDLTIPLALALGYALARISSSGFNELRNALFSQVSHSACRVVACTTFAHLHSLDLDVLMQSKSGELTTVLSRGIRSITQLLNMMLFQVFPTLLEFVMVLSLLTYTLGATVAGITTATMVGYIIFTLNVTARRTELRRLMNQAEQRSNGLLLDSLINAEAVRLFTNESFELNRYTAYQRDFEKTNVQVAKSLAFLNFGQQAIFNVGLWSAMAVTAVQVANGIIPIGHMALITSLLFQLAIPLNFIGSVYRETRLNLTDLEKLHELLSIAPRVSESPQAVPFVLKHSNASPSLRFENVHFEYYPQQGLLDEPQTGTKIRQGGKALKGHALTPSSVLHSDGPPLPPAAVLQGLDFEVPSGQTVGVVGPSGSGKTTLVKLLYRFFDPTSGRILLDGEDIRNFKLRSFRQFIGVVPQDVVLFNESILYNLKYGRPTATDAEIIEAAKAAQIHDKIVNSFPNGYNTLVGERGLKLSGGEKQRVGIARCLLRDPRIVIFDEATSSLDSATEHEVLEEFKTMIQGRTSLVIAHRLATVVDADQICYVDKGVVQERGTHRELLRIPNGHYARLWARQRSVEEIVP